MAPCHSRVRANLFWNPDGVGCNKVETTCDGLVDRALHKDPLCYECDDIGIFSTDETVHSFGQHEHPASQRPSEMASIAEGPTDD